MDEGETLTGVAITPGTTFMAGLTDSLAFWASQKVNGSANRRAAWRGNSQPLPLCGCTWRAALMVGQRAVRAYVCLAALHVPLPSPRDRAVGRDCHGASRNVS
jgi:hypothetical protein